MPHSKFPPPTPPIDEQPKPVRPAGVDTAFRLTLAGLAIGAIGSVIRLLFDDAWVNSTVRRFLADSATVVSEADTQRLISVFSGAGVVGVLLVTGVFVLVAVKMRAGRNWARMTLAVFAVYGLVTFLNSVAAVGAALDLTWNLAEAAFRAAAVVYLFRPDTAEFFGKGKRAR
ncbi:MAG: hypothetical protein M3548_08280 [Actinomycetota bacterium]|nr:hypothetical protein [Actinomycetota bacterium]